MPIKSTTTTKGEKKKREKNLQNKSKRKNKKFVMSSESFPSLRVTVYLTSLGSPPTLC